MAITVFVEVSTTTVAPSAFTPLTSYPDTGAPVTYNHAPTVPGQLYIYRARRFDDSSGLYSDWSYAYVRGAYSERDTKMIDPNQVWTSAYEALFVAVETFEKVPTKAVYRVAMVSGGFTNQIDIVNSSVKRDTVTARQSTLKGMFKYTGDYQIEVRPEGGFLCFACASDKYLSSATNSSPTSYTHTYANQKGLKSLTLIHKIGDIYFVYAGVKVMEFAMSPDYNGTNTLVASFKLGASGFFFLDKKITPTAETILGIDTAILDITTPYPPQDGVVRIAGVRGAGAKDLSFTQTNNFEEYRERDGTRTSKAMIQGIGDTTLSVTTYFSRKQMRSYYRSLGYATDPSAAATIQRTTVVVPVSLSFTPPPSVGGIVNTLVFDFPNVDMNVSVKPPSGEGSVELSFDGKPWDPVGNAYNSDFGMKITNSLDNTQIISPGTPIDPLVLPSDKVESRWEIGKVAAGGTTTSISAGSTNPHFDDVDGAYIGAAILFITGTLAGQSHDITAYTAATRTWTTSAFGSAPTTGDAFVVL